MKQKISANILMIMDPYLTREKRRILSRTIQQMKSHFSLDLKEIDTTEEDTLTLTKTKKYDIILAPWHQYLTWGKIEGSLGFTRTNGPVFAGYFAEPINTDLLTNPPMYNRLVLLNFYSTTPKENISTLKTLSNDYLKSGIIPFFEKRKPIYCDTWNIKTNYEDIIAKTFSLLELDQFDWSQRASAIRICLMHMWSFIFEHPDTKAYIVSQQTPHGQIKAFFEISCNETLLIMRIWFSIGNWAPKDLINRFWPNQEISQSSPFKITDYCDYLRANIISDKREVEITVGFLKSKGIEIYPHFPQTICIQPISSRYTQEHPLNVYIKKSEGHRILSEEIKHSTHQEYKKIESNKIDLLMEKLDEKEKQLNEMKNGGIGYISQNENSTLDLEALFESINLQTEALKIKIQKINQEILHLQQNHTDNAQLAFLNGERAELIEKESKIFNKLSFLIEKFNYKKIA